MPAMTFSRIAYAPSDLRAMLDQLSDQYIETQDLEGSDVRLEFYTPPDGGDHAATIALAKRVEADLRKRGAIDVRLYDHGVRPPPRWSDDV